MQSTLSRRGTKRADTSFSLMQSSICNFCWTCRLPLSLGIRHAQALSCFHGNIITQNPASLVFNSLTDHHLTLSCFLTLSSPMWIKRLVTNASELNVAEVKAFLIKASKKKK